jgi:signal transduction histidine kinase
MASMQERARILNAKWEMTSTPDSGTVVRIELPVDAAA